MAEINVEFVKYGTDKDQMVPTRPNDMIPETMTDASRKTVTGTALTGSNRITVPPGETAAQITALGAAIRVKVGVDPTADQNSNLVPENQTFVFPVLPGQLISAILNTDLA